MLGPLGDAQGTSPGRRVQAGLLEMILTIKNNSYPDNSLIQIKFGKTYLH